MDKLIKIDYRKIVPIAAMISAGKSKILNVLFNIEFLECRAGIGTKFVNILRYNPNIEKPIFYHLLCKEQENGEYAFYKDPYSEVKVGEEAIIEENKNINNILAAKLDINYEEIFYMTELNNIGFIKDKEYLLTHDLCDIPGLSEYQNTDDNTQKVTSLSEENNKQKKEDNEIEDLLEKGRQFGLVIKPKEPKVSEQNDNRNINDDKEEQDDLYYKIDVEKEKTYATEVFKRIKNYIDGAIIVLSIQNFYHTENFEIIIKLHKIINKEFHNFLIILNKIDLSTNPNYDIEKCKGLFLKYFPKCKTFNFNLNTFVPTSAIQVQNELLMKTSFRHLIKYHFYNYVSNVKKEKLINATPHCKSFIDHLLDFLKKVAGTLKKQDIENKVDTLNQSEENEKCENEIKAVLRELKDTFKADDINIGISEEEISTTENENDFEDDFESENNTDDDIKNLKPSYIIKMIYIFFKENKYIPPISPSTSKLLNYFTMKNLRNIEIFNDKENTEITKVNNDIIDQLKVFCREIEKSKTGNKTFENVTNELIRIIEFLKIYDVIFIPFLGPSNAGKSTIINGIIGKEVLPSDLNECTKRGIIIRYSDNDETTIRKANFKEEHFLDRINYYFQAGSVIGKGIDQVKDTLQGLNLEFNEKEEDSFYYIRTKIKLFDELGLDKTLKHMIYLIDFPGFGTRNFFEKEIYNKVMSICNSFIFVVRNTVIKENTSKQMFKRIFEQAKNQKQIFMSKFLKSCLFVFNNDREQSTTQEDLDLVKKDIRYLVNNNDSANNIIDENDIKACFFNAKYYSNYCSNYNYFYELKELFDKEYKNYQEIKCNLYKQPNAIEININNTFFDYLYKALLSKVKNEFDQKITGKQKIDENIEKITNDEFNKIKENENLKDISKIKTKLLQLLSFGQENISEIKTLKESGVENLKYVLLNQIAFINKSKQEELQENLNNVINCLDLFFDRDFSERQKDFTKIKIFGVNMKGIKRDFQNLIDKNEEKAKVLEESYISEVDKSLKLKKSDLEELLKNKKEAEVLEQINHEISSSLESLHKELTKYIEENDNESERLLIKAKEYVDEIDEKSTFSIDKLDNYLSKILSEKGNLKTEIFNEIKNSCESLSDIFSQKGFKEWLISVFSSKNYLENVIDMIIETFKNKIGVNISLIRDNIRNYLNDNLRKIDNWISCVTMNFNEEEKKKWKQLCISYKTTREKIIKLKIN